MTPGDLQQIAQLISAAEQRTNDRATEAEQRIKDHATEIAHDLQTEVLRRLEAFARGNFAASTRWRAIRRTSTREWQFSKNVCFTWKLAGLPNNHQTSPLLATTCRRAQPQPVERPLTLPGRNSICAAGFATY